MLDGRGEIQNEQLGIKSWTPGLRCHAVYVTGSNTLTLLLILLLSSHTIIYSKLLSPEQLIRSMALSSLVPGLSKSLGTRLGPQLLVATEDFCDNKQLSVGHASN